MNSIHGSSPIEKVQISIDGVPKFVRAEGFVEALDGLKQSTAIVKIVLSPLQRWSFDLFQEVVAFACALKDRVRFQVNEKVVGSDLFEAVLTFPVNVPDLAKCAEYKRQLLLSAIAWHPEVLKACCRRIQTRLNDLEFGGDALPDLYKQANELISAQAEERLDSGEQTFVCDAIDGAPVGDDLVVPAGYRMSVAGVAHTGEDEFIATPILIAGRMIDVNTQLERIQIKWLRDGIWKSEIFARSIIADARSIITLADYGVIINSTNAKEVVGFFAAIESANSESLSVSHVTSKLGYHDEPEGPVFVLPLESIAVHDTTIQFACNSSGYKKVADAYHSCGQLSDWVGIVNSISAFPKMLLLLACSLAPALSAVFRFANIIVDTCSRTTAGKTIGLRFAASVWGNPDERSRSSLLLTFNATEASIERTANLASDLPMIIDDSKNAVSAEFVSKVIYQIGQGQGRGRATPEGLQETAHYRTICLTSGERPLTGFTKDGGTRARTISLWGSPFGDYTAELGEFAENLNQQVIENFGLAGPKFVKFVLANRKQWNKWGSHFRHLSQTYATMAKESENQFAARMAPSLAAISMALRLAHKCFGFDFPYRDVVADLWDEICSSSSMADQSIAALSYVFNFAIENQDRFDRGPGNRLAGHVSYLGRWDTQATVPGDDDSESGKSWDCICVIPTVLERIIKEGGYEFDAVIRAWADAGFLKTTECGRRQIKTRIGSEKAPVYVYAIRRSALEQNGLL